MNNHGEGAENVDDWDKDGNAGTGHQSERGSRGFRGRRGGGPRQNDRSSFNSNRKCLLLISTNMNTFYCK